MSRFTQIRLALSKMMAQFTDIPTDKATLVTYDASTLEEGVDVYVEKDGEYVPAENGEYVLQDGSVVVVESGIVKEVRAVNKEAFEAVEPVEPAPVAEPTEPAPAEPIVEPVAEPEPIITPDPWEEHKEEFNQRFTQYDSRVADLESQLQKAVTAMAEMQRVMTEQQELVTKMSHMSAAQPSTIDIEPAPKSATGNAKLDERLKKMFPGK